MNHLCECGCGEEVTVYRGKPRRFVSGHNGRGKRRSAETRRKISQANKGKSPSDEIRRKMSEAHKGDLNFNYGKRPSAETRRKLSEGQRGILGNNYGKRASPETRRKMSGAHKGHAVSAETRRKLSEANKGQTRSAETRRNISEAHKGKTPSAETRRKLSEANSRERSGTWQGGKSFEPYGLEFNKALKRAIRERDEFTCQLCGALENGQAHSCHHIDYNKRNNDPLNLIALCNRGGCHTKTNLNRSFYTNLFQAQAKLAEYRS